MPVKQWMTPVNGLSLLRLAQDRDGVVFGVARMHDKRQLRASRCRDVGAEIRNLRLARAVVVIIIETGFAEANHLLGCVLSAQQHIGTRQRLLGGLVRVHADSAMNVGRGFRDGAHAGKALQLRGDGEEMAHTRLPRAGEHGFEFRSEFGEIEMAMAIDEHGRSLSKGGAQFK